MCIRDRLYTLLVLTITFSMNAQMDDNSHPSNNSAGTYSVAMGINTTASGDASTAMGASSTASGDYSFAIGQGTDSDGNTSSGTPYYTNEALGIRQQVINPLQLEMIIYLKVMGQEHLEKIILLWGIIPFL